MRVAGQSEKRRGASALLPDPTLRAVGRVKALDARPAAQDGVVELWFHYRSLPLKVPCGSGGRRQGQGGSPH